MLLNVSNPKPVQVNREDLSTTEEFTYLGRIVRHDGGAEGDIKNRFYMARNTFRTLNNVEVLSVQHQDQAEDLLKLCDIHPTIRLWMLEDDRERHHQAVS